MALQKIERILYFSATAGMYRVLTFTVCLLCALRSVKCFQYKFLSYFEHFLCAKQVLSAIGRVLLPIFSLGEQAGACTFHISSQPCRSHMIVLCFVHKETRVPSG